MNQKVCSHITSLSALKIAKHHICKECAKTGGTWVHLRTCQTCGAVLCCDSSPNQHMTAHYHQTQHPVISSAEPDEYWLWCYVDEVFVEYENDLN